LLFIITSDKEFEGKNPPDEIIVIERFNESKSLKSTKVSTKKIINVKKE